VVIRRLESDPLIGAFYLYDDIIIVKQQDFPHKKSPC
jgi:hypothetical protein